MVKLKDRSGNF